MATVAQNIVLQENAPSISRRERIGAWIYEHPTTIKTARIAGFILGVGLLVSIPFVAALGTGVVAACAITGGFLTLASFVALRILNLLFLSQHAAHRLLLLDGDNGTVACRVHGIMSGTMPQLSDHKRVELASRSLLRMRNLNAVRGIPGSSMIGPLDYFGNLEEPHKYLYTIKNGSHPSVDRRSITNENMGEAASLKKLDENAIRVFKAKWISGKEGELTETKKEEYQVTSKHLRHSLFLNPGLLEIDRSLIELSSFDARGVDLSSFKARLVDNTIPFQITKTPLPAKDDYRLVTYLYEPGYANWQVQQGSGLFLEKHRFSQTMTPMNPNAKGFVVLGRINENPDELELIGIQIPYGHTLIIEEGCIHGDTTLNGLFMMGMTSDHTTMQTADTVFLKDTITKKNVSMAMTGIDDNQRASDSQNVSSVMPPPYVIYKGANIADRAKFKELTKGQDFILNPFSREHWST